MEISKLLRPHLHHLTPYASARDDFMGSADVYLDANENAFGSTSENRFRRYPDPYQAELKSRIAALKGLDRSQIFVGHGSDEPIDLMIRAFCNPGKDKIITTPPTYGMYQVSAAINDVGIVEVPLLPDFSLNHTEIMEAMEPGIKLIFLCSPNNPTGNSMNQGHILEILKRFQGLVVLDEAYIDFSPKQSLINELTNYKNLVILQTLSKSWGLASLRVGMTFAHEEVIGVLNMIKPPYNISGATQELAIRALESKNVMPKMLSDLEREKKHLKSMLHNINIVHKVYPSDANFYLVKVEKAPKVYKALIEKGIVVRDRSDVILCRDCLRITVGTQAENEKLVKSLESIEV
jgi:histidinol-phosphate aminotransferase